MWDSRKLRPVAVLSGHTDSVLSADFSHNGKFIATASQDTTARVRVAHSGELIAELRGHTGPVNTAVFSADDRRVLTSSKDGTARIWSMGMADPAFELTESGVPRLSQDPQICDLATRQACNGSVIQRRWTVGSYGRRRRHREGVGGRKRKTCRRTAWTPGRYQRHPLPFKRKKAAAWACALPGQTFCVNSQNDL